MERWVGRVAIVTGASAGIGADIACALAEQGMKVVAVARREERIKALVAELGQVKGELHTLACDVTREEDVTRVVTWTRETLGGADVLVNNAGVNFPGLLTEISTSDMQKILNTNILGLSMLTRDVITDMRSRGVDDGHIFHIGSAVGQRIHDYPGICLYSASKHAVRVLTEGLRRELRDLKTNIRVTSRAATLENKEHSKSLREYVTIEDETFMFGVGEYVTWSAAEQICEDNGMRLLTLEEESRWNTIQSFINGNAVYDHWWWTSGRKPLNTLDFVWTTTNKKVSYDVWYPNQPSNAQLTDDSCMQMNPGNEFSPSGWDDVRCADAITPYICEPIPSV